MYDDMYNKTPPFNTAEPELFMYYFVYNNI